MKKVVVIGNGPAGISAAIYTTRANIDTTVIGKGYGALETANVENYYGFESPISGKELVDAGIRQIKRLGATFIEDEVLNIIFQENDENGKPLYLVKTSKGEFLVNAVVIAVGKESKKASIENLDAFEGHGVSYCAICDAFFYKGKDVCVIGSGKYALSEVNDLLPIVGSVTLLTNGSAPEVEFPENVKVIESKISALNAEDSTGMLNSISFDDGSKLNFAGAFIAEGSASSLAFSKKLGIFTQNNKISVSENMQTNLLGVYAAGDCIGGIFQIAKAVSDGALAGISIAKYLRN